MKLRNIHHIVPTSRWWEVHRWRNTIDLDIDFHTALHILYWNASPLQQVIMLMQYEKSFRWNKASDMYDLIEYHKIWDHNDVYQPGVIINPALIWREVKSHSSKAKNILDAHRYVHYSERAHPEAKIYTLLALADSVLTSNFKKKATDILA